MPELDIAKLPVDEKVRASQKLARDKASKILKEGGWIPTEVTTVVETIAYTYAIATSRLVGGESRVIGTHLKVASTDLPSDNVPTVIVDPPDLPANSDAP